MSNVKITKGEKIMKEKVMSLVKEIADGKSASCRGLDKWYLARKLMNLANIPRNAIISEIPVYWDDQVIIYFLIPGDDNYYTLFAGIGLDGNFYFELTITGKLLNNGMFHFFEEDEKEDEELPIDYFLK